MTDEIPKVDELDGWPERGHKYQVPCIRQVYCSTLDWWPVWTKAMIDNFRGNRELAPSGPHYHIDPRFLTDEQMDILAANWAESAKLHKEHGLNPKMAVMSLSRHNDWMKYALSVTVPANVPRLQNLLDQFRAEISVPCEYRILTCRVHRIEWDVPARDEFWDVKPITPKGEPQPAIVKNDRPTCPHNGFDLTAVWDGESETVRCPLHGLLVDVTGCLERRAGVAANSDAEAFLAVVEAEKHTPCPDSFRAREGGQHDPA